MEGERAEPDGAVTRRRSDTRRIAVVMTVWTLATVFGLAVAATTKIGPVLLRLSVHHGVHLGDVIAFLVAYTAAALLTLWKLDG